MQAKKKAPRLATPGSLWRRNGLFLACRPHRRFGVMTRDGWLKPGHLTPQRRVAKCHQRIKTNKRGVNEKKGFVKRDKELSSDGSCFLLGQTYKKISRKKECSFGLLLYLLNKFSQTKVMGRGALGRWPWPLRRQSRGQRFADPTMLCCRRQSDVLVAGPWRGEAELLGRVPARRAAVLLQPGGELHGHELLLQLRRRQRRMVPFQHVHSTFARGQIRDARTCRQTAKFIFTLLFSRYLKTMS